MPRAEIHPHPTHDFKCKHCKFWHPAYVENYAVQPGTQTLQNTKALIAQGVNFTAWITNRMSQCFHDPQWVIVGEDSYCANYDSGSLPRDFRTPMKFPPDRT